MEEDDEDDDHGTDVVQVVQPFPGAAAGRW